MALDSKTGKAGGASVGGVAITITSWKAKVKKEMAESTDSSNYVPGTNQLWKAQLPGAVSLEGTLEGHWSAASTPSGLIAKLTIDTVQALLLKYDQSTNFASCNADLSDFEIGATIPGAETIDFTATFMSNGVVVLS